MMESAESSILQKFRRRLEEAVKNHPGLGPKRAPPKEMSDQPSTATGPTFRQRIEQAIAKSGGKLKLDPPPGAPKK